MVKADSDKYKNMLKEVRKLCENLSLKFWHLALYVVTYKEKGAISEEAKLLLNNKLTPR